MSRTGLAWPRFPRFPRSAPGEPEKRGREGRLYYYNDRWNVHYMFRDTPVVANIGEAEAKPLSKAALRKVFDEMKAHAG